MGDVGQIGAAGVTSAANLAATAMTNQFNAANVKATNASQERIAADNNAMQIGMSRENNQFSHDEAALAYNRQVEQWQRQAQYDSPVEQLKRFQAAGLNPSVAFGGNLANAASSAPSVAAAAPHGSGVTPSMPNLIPFRADAPQFGTDLINAISSLARAKRDSAEGSQIATLTDSMLKSLNEDVRGKVIANDIQEIYGKEMANVNLHKAIEEVALIAQQAATLASQGKLNEALQKKAQAEKVLAKANTNLTRKQARNWQLQNETFLKKFDAQLRTWSSEQAENYAAAEQYHAAAVTENTLRDVRKELLGYEADIKSIDAKVEKQLDRQGIPYQQRLDDFLQNRYARLIDKMDLDKAKELYPIAVEMYKLDYEKGNPREWLYYVDKVMSAAAGTGAAAIGAYSGSRIAGPGKARSVRGFKP